MAIKLRYVKLGSIPFGPALVKSKRKMPKVGDIIYIRLDNSDKILYDNPWKRVKVDSINEDGSCHFVHSVGKCGA